MSAYDTVERTDDYWVRVYIEAPHDNPGDDWCRVALVVLEGADWRDRVSTYLTADKAEAIGKALIKAAARARQANPMEPR